MASDLVELGLEGVNYVADKYHDAIYEGLGRVRPWITTQRGRIQSRSRSRSRSRSKKRPASQELQAIPASPTSPLSHKMPNGENSRPDGQRPRHYSRGRDRDGYRSDEDRGPRETRRERERDVETDYYGQRERVEEWARRSQGPLSPPPHIQIEKTNDDSHIYPPPPQPMQPPYPTAGQLIPMPPDAPYPLQRSRSDNRPDPRSRSMIPRDDYDDRSRPLIMRSRSANYGRGRQQSRSWSRERGRDRSLDRGYRPRSGRQHRDIDNPHHSSRHFNHVTAGIAGALAGGYLGKEVSKGDMAATVAGALVGALGAGVAEREWERHKGRHRKEESKWDMAFGRR